MATFRHSRADEDDVLARILYNGFLYNWDNNWWQNLRSPLRIIASTPHSPHETLTTTESARLGFYWSFIRMVRCAGGSIVVAVPSTSEQPAAVLCWLPPRTPITFWSVIRSGFATALLRFGFIGVYHFIYFVRGLDRIYRRTLGPLGYTSKDVGAIAQMIATDPTHRGKGFAASLLKWQIEQHFRVYPHTPVFLDTAGEYQRKVYERVGFRELGRHRLEIHVDKLGFPPAGNQVLSDDERADPIQMVMTVDPKAK